MPRLSVCNVLRCLLLGLACVGWALLVVIMGAGLFKLVQFLGS